MRPEQVEHLGNGVQHGFAALSDPLLAVEPWPETLVQFMTCLALQPCTQCVGQDRRLRCAWPGCQIFQSTRQVIGQVKLVTDLAGLHGTRIAAWHAHEDGADPTRVDEWDEYETYMRIAETEDRSEERRGGKEGDRKGR